MSSIGHAGSLLGGRLGGFLTRFLGHTPSFRRFRRINHGGIAGLVMASWNQAGRWASLMTSEYGLQGIRRTTRPLVECAPWARKTSNSINRGLAAMPAQERSLRVDGRGLGGDQSYDQRQHREAMAGKTSPQGSSPRADARPSQWDDADWDQDHDEAACHRARRLLSRSNSGFHRFGRSLRRRCADGSPASAG